MPDPRGVQLCRYFRLPREGVHKIRRRARDPRSCLSGRLNPARRDCQSEDPTIELLAYRLDQARLSQGQEYCQ